MSKHYVDGNFKSKDFMHGSTITGYMDIWGPCLGMEIIAPFGNPSQTPSLNVSPGENFMKQGGTRQWRFMRRLEQ
jgi:hypothetical protein